MNMTTILEPESIPSESLTVASIQSTSGQDSSGHSQRPKRNTTALQFRCMMILAAGFFLEVLVYSIIPEDSPLRFLKGVSVAVLSLLVTWCMFRFAVND